MTTTKQKKTYWNTTLSPNYRFQYQESKDAKPVQRAGVLRFAQSYGIGVTDSGKKILELTLRYPMEPLFGIISCDRIDRLWELCPENISGEQLACYDELCECFAEGILSAQEVAHEIVKMFPIERENPCVSKRVTPGIGKFWNRKLARYLESGLAIWLSNGSGLRE